MRKSSYISVDPDFRRSLVKALLRGANHIEIILNLIRWDWTCDISPKSRRPDHINESWPGSDKADPSALKRDSRKLRGPFLACGDGKGTRERSGRHDFARAERRTELILRQRFGEMAQREQRPVEDVGRGPVIDKDSVAEKIDLEARKLASPLLLPRSS